MLNFVCVLQAIKLLDMVYTTPEMINSENVFTCLSKIIPNLVVSMTKLLHQSTNCSLVFAELSIDWAEDKIMSTQGKLQQVDVALVYMFKMKTKHPSIKRLQNTNSFCLVECISVAWKEKFPVSVLLAETFSSSGVPCGASRIFHW